MKFYQKSSVVEGWQYTKEAIGRPQWLLDIDLYVLGKTMRTGDWIMREPNGEISVCRSEDLELFYEKVEE